jgi:hypothetical protein
VTGRVGPVRWGACPRWRVRWGGAQDSGLKAEVLLVLLQTGARSYDVSVPTAPATAGRLPT